MTYSFQNGEKKVEFRLILSVNTTVQLTACTPLACGQNYIGMSQQNCPAVYGTTAISQLQCNAPIPCTLQFLHFMVNFGPKVIKRPFL